MTTAGRGLVGRQIGHYRVLRQLGAGGMGEVFLADDIQLGRRIALKVLHPGTATDPQRLARFRQEAKVLASVNHPGIVTVYSVEHAEGLEFITMELVEGRTLSGELSRSWLDLDRFFEIAIPLADAISVAHEKGITHRDLKPGNIMVTPSRSIKILDFGLAKLLQELQAGDADHTQLTEEFQVIGTPGYMSPEQIRGDAVDHRTDIFSLGIVLYEMATGQRPFEGSSSVEVASAVLRENPTPATALAPDLPRQLGRIIGQCLEKDADFRFQTARDVFIQLRELRKELREEQILSTAVDLSKIEARRPESRAPKLLIGGTIAAVAIAALALFRTLSPPEPPPPGTEGSGETPRVVVLPFENLGSPQDAYFADGMTEEITSRLATIDGLSVISRTTAVQVAAAGMGIEEIGEELGVGFVLEGTVRWSRSADESSRVRVTPQLIRVADDTHLWATTYDEVIEDVFEVQSAIAEAVIASLDVNLLGSDRRSLESRPTGSVEAYQAFLRARDWMRQPLSEQTQRMTVGMLERAVELDPDFGLAWAELARHHALLYFNNWDDSSGRLDSAKSALENAGRLMPGEPHTRLASGFYRYYGLSDYAGALQEFESAAAGLPNDSDTLQAVGLVQRRLGQLEQAVTSLSTALDLDPHNVDLLDLIAETEQAQRRYEQADRLWKEAIARAPDRDVLYRRLAENELRWRGDLATVHEILGRAPGGEATLFSWDRIDFLDLDLVGRDFESLLDRLGREPQEDRVKEAKRQLIMGVAAHLAGRDGGGEAFFDSSRAIYEALLSEAPAIWRYRSGLGLALAFRGEHAAAIDEGRQAVEGDAADLFTGPMRQENLAAIYAWSGDVDRSIELLGELLAKPYQKSLSPALLALDPVWDPLRDDPRFHELTQGP